MAKVCPDHLGSTYLIGGLEQAWKKDLLAFITEKTTDALWVAFLYGIFPGVLHHAAARIFKLPDPDMPPSEEGQEDQERAASMSEEEMKEIKNGWNGRWRKHPTATQAQPQRPGGNVRHQPPIRFPGSSMMDMA